VGVGDVLTHIHGNDARELTAVRHALPPPPRLPLA
jgi:hypothetical protein